SDDHTIRSWDAAGAPGLVSPHDYWVRDLAVSPDGSLVAGSSLRNDLRVWDAKSGKLRYKLLGNGKMGGMRRVRFTPDGTRLIAWGDDEFVRVWDVRNGKLLAEHTTRPADVKIDEDDPFAESRRMMTLLGTADISADGSALALAIGRGMARGEGKGIRIIDPLTGKLRTR